MSTWTYNPQTDFHTRPSSFTNFSFPGFLQKATTDLMYALRCGSNAGGQTMEKKGAVEDGDHGKQQEKYTNIKFYRYNIAVFCK